MVWVNKYDRKLTELDVVITRIRYRVNGVYMSALSHQIVDITITQSSVSQSKTI